MFGTCMLEAIDYVINTELVYVSDLIEKIVPCTSPESFILTKQYKVKEAIEQSYGKWPDQLGNGFWIESEYLLDDLMDMAKSAILNNYRENQMLGEIKGGIEDCFKLIQKTTNKENWLHQYAIQIIGKYAERDSDFIYTQALKGGSLLKGELKITTKISHFLWHLRKYDLNIMTPIVHAI